MQLKLVGRAPKSRKVRKTLSRKNIPRETPSQALEGDSMAEDDGGEDEDEDEEHNKDGSASEEERNDDGGNDDA